MTDNEAFKRIRYDAREQSWKAAYAPRRVNIGCLHPIFPERTGFGGIHHGETPIRDLTAALISQASKEGARKKPAAWPRYRKGSHHHAELTVPDGEAAIALYERLWRGAEHKMHMPGSKKDDARLQSAIPGLRG
jgi:hypothetical protein